MKTYYTYMMASGKNGTIYTGFTSELQTRVGQHKRSEIDGFTKKYHVHKLVYFEATNDVNDAIVREKQLKHWNRAWKIELIDKDNPGWRDLSEDWE